MDAPPVLELMAGLRAAGVRVWIAGGWGVDALLGRQTRPHRDLDLIHDVEHEAVALEVLAAHGFRETADERPVRFVLRDEGGLELDLHPVRFAPDGSARQATYEEGVFFDYPADCFVTGTIDGETVPCVSAAQQAYFHQGYEPAERDLHDMARLRAAFGIPAHGDWLRYD
jgi:lincosamide nucleotidyltransferase A/C/D/E